MKNALSLNRLTRCWMERIKKTIKERTEQHEVRIIGINETMREAWNVF